MGSQNNSYLQSKIPEGLIKDKWDNYKFSASLVNPANKKKFEIIVVGAGLAGASAAASLAEMGYKVKVFVIHDSPRRAHSIAAQGESMLLKITKMMEILLKDFFMTPLKVEILGLEKPMFIVCAKFQELLLISV